MAPSPQLSLFPVEPDHLLDTNLSEACSRWRQFFAPQKRFYVPAFGQLIGQHNIAITELMKKHGQITTPWSTSTLARAQADTLAAGEPLSYMKAVECVLCLNMLLAERNITTNVKRGQIICAVFYVDGFSSYYQAVDAALKQRIADHLSVNRRALNVSAVNQDFAALLAEMNAGLRVTFQTAYAVVQSIAAVDTAASLAKQQAASLYKADLPGKGLRKTGVPGPAPCEDVIAADPHSANPYEWRFLARARSRS